MFGKRILIGDGGLGTALQGQGMPVGVSPECWALERPEVVEDVTRQFFASGSDFVLTNTFGGNRPRLASVGRADRIHEVNVESVRIARRVAPPGRYVFGSVGPTGSTGTGEEIEEVYREQAGLLAEAGVDAFWVETVCSTAEGAAAVRAIRSITDLPVAILVTLAPNRQSLLLLSEESLGDAIRSFLTFEPAAIGVNCVSVDLLRSAVSTLTETLNTPLAIFPNAGTPHLVGGHPQYDADQNQLAETVFSLKGDSPVVLGGCCGTTSEYVRRLSDLRTLEANCQV